MMKMKGITADRREEIVTALKARGVKLPCPRCDNESFTLLEGYFVQPIQTETKDIFVGGPTLTVPSVVSVCNQCGFISQHALGALGVQLKETKEKSE
jgi:hypothetical protein